MSTGFGLFDSTVQKTNEILKAIEEEFGWENRRNQSYLALRVVLQALRDRLPVQDAVNFGAGLPMLIRGFYYEGWNPAQVPVKMDGEEFLERIRTAFQFDFKGNIGDLVRTVFSVLKNSLGFGEMEKLRNTLPEDFKKYL